MKSIFKKIKRIIFTDNVVPDEYTHYNCIPAIDIDSVLKIDKKAFPQAYLQQCKYKLKKRKPVSFIGSEIIDDEDNEIINDKNDNKNDDDYPCIYGRMINF